MIRVFIYYLISLTIITLGCNSHSKSELIFKNKLGEIIHSAKSDTISIKMAELVEFEWDYFLVIPPYTIIDRLEDEMMIDLEKVKRTQIQYREDINVLCFIKNDKLVDCFIQPFHPIDFKYLEGLSHYTRNNSNFTLVKKGEEYFIVVSE